MKKVKIMLTAVAVLAVVGGALAFKAKNYGARIFCTTATGSNLTCPTPVDNWTVADPGTIETLSSTCTDEQDASCVKTTIYKLD